MSLLLSQKMDDSSSILVLSVCTESKKQQPFLIWSVALIISGGIGNLIDRIFLGYVVDFIDLRIINFAVFNFADCCVVIGVIMVFIYVLFLSGRKEKTKEQENV